MAINKDIIIYIYKQTLREYPPHPLTLSEFILNSDKDYTAYNKDIMIKNTLLYQ